MTATIAPASRYARKIRPTVWFLLAWMFLNILMNLDYPFTQADLWAALKLSPEIWGLLILLSIGVGLGMPWHPLIYVPLTGFMLFLRAFRIGDVLMPMYFYRNFNLYIDIHYIPDLLDLLYNTVPLPVLLGYSLLALVVTFLAIWGMWRAFATLHAYFVRRQHRLLFGGISLLLFGAWIGGHVTGRWQPSAIFAQEFASRVVEEVNFMLHVKGYNAQNQAVIHEAEVTTASTAGSLGKLEGADVYLIYIESYGHTALADPRHAPLILPVLRHFEQTLTAHGFTACSHLMTSATYGGASWLAHATMATGVRTHDQLQYNLVLTSTITPLAEHFNNAGYRTISVKPNTTLPWPEGKFFEYQRTYYAWDFAYAGPQFGWATMPDQFVLESVFRREIQPRPRPPVLIEYALVSSHAPFHCLPPYLDDWSQIGDGAIYHDIPPVTFPVTWTDLSNASEAYAAAIRYDLRVLEAYLARYIEDDALILILGDHQPNVQLTGEESLWSVPIHVISRNPAFLEPFKQRGYIAGMIPDQPLPHHGMETFLTNFLEDFRRSPEEARE
ncbi:hypothetical protein GF339_12365 [candidate division KSB3 bacterium]|uniref:Sulfatase N-terminal domain-containing protein n=1 Tax=candidate division KSB3 bacterium TaxID=2044937 RepID=A0A9D5JWE3_9BACT|nr:hypothetical protein [candidate division KSB3 bacterium]MBD3325375.1 hypothetical protein [candidate division KSB3 bacterium]